MTLPTTGNKSVVRTNLEGTCVRLIGTYGTEKEARFIAKKAEKMEKMSIMLRKIKEDPSLEGKISISNIVLGDVVYEVRTIMSLQGKRNIDGRVTNGVSNILHFMDDRNPHEKRIAKKELSSNGYLSFSEFVMLRESDHNLRAMYCKDWNLINTEVQDEQ